MKVFVTGAAGFIGSHLVESLLKADYEVVALDNLSTGTINNLSNALKFKRFTFIQGDIRIQNIIRNNLKDCDVIIHLAANSNVRIGYTDSSIDYDNNINGTKAILDVFKESRTVKRILFASSGTIYGKASVVPTPETYGPLSPISLYASSKLACESLIAAYAQLFDKEAIIFRLANVVGARANRGVIVDFITKLRKNPSYLEILGNGKQKKSYIHVLDCVSAFILGLKMQLQTPVEFFNVGSHDSIDVNTIAQIVMQKIGLRKDLTFNISIPSGGGWPGDLQEMLLDSGRIYSRGWNPKHDSRKAVELAIQEIMATMDSGNKTAGR